MSLQKVDPNSPEFKTELVKTVKFTDKVIKQFGFAYNPDKEITQGVQYGLTRNKLIYGKRYCPCFFVTQTKEDRICPCKPALNEEVPGDGKCHCGIFCTPEFAKESQQDETMEAAIHAHSRGLTQEECELLLKKEQLDSDELAALLEARELNMVDFKVVDIREWMENQAARIAGTDFLCPTTSFFEAIDTLKEHQDKALILYCHVGSRSAYCQRILQDMKFSHVGNLTHGIVSYRGKIEKG